MPLKCAMVFASGVLAYARSPDPGYDVLAVLSVITAGTRLRTLVNPLNTISLLCALLRPVPSPGLEALAVAILLKPSNKGNVLSKGPSRGQIVAALQCIVVIVLKADASPRLHFMSWNAGGLSSERYQQVALWLRTHGQHLAITVIQETHWASDLTFKIMEGWLALASPSQDRVSGILVLVNLRFFQRDQIQLTSVIEGRLVHLRLEGNPSLDVVIVYQHLYSSSKALPGAAGLEQALLRAYAGRGTQIDFALTRQITADGIARRTCLDPHCTLPDYDHFNPQSEDSADPAPLEAEMKEAAKNLKLLCAQNRQHRIQQILQEAEQAAHKGNSPHYFCRLYRSSLPEPHPPGHSFAPFDVEELTGVITQLPSGKALPSWLAPAPLWSLAAAPVADVIHPALTQWLTHMTDPMPGQWPKSSLCLLAKPSKPPKCPENLRPIALLHPVSKCLAKLAAGLLRPTVQHLATRFPQFAYIGGRSVEDSIERACSRCAAVRTTLEAQKYNIHLRRQGHVTGKCKGGITLSLDLSRAFDCLPREILHKALVFAAVEPTLIDLILHIHRQVHEPEDILRILQDIAFIIDTLTSLGMSVSDSKTVILDGLRGPAKSRLLRPLLQRHKDKGPCLRVMCATGPLDLPFRKQHPYLGIVLSYDCFEKLSLQTRIKQSWANFSRLFSLLRSKHILPTQRLQLWTACVFSTLRYGLTSTGLPPRGPDLIRQVVAKQVRLVLKSPSWITHETTADLYARFRFQDPIVQLSKQLQSRQSRPSLSIEAFDTPERLHWRAALPASFVSATSAPSTSTTQPGRETSCCSLMDVSGIVTRTYACPHCPQTFPTLIALRTHCTKSHGPSSDQAVAPPVEPDAPPVSTETTTSPDSAAATLVSSTGAGVPHSRPPSQQQLRARFMHFAKDGMPHCTLCNRKFAAWPPFLNHHYTNSCPAQVHDDSLIKNPAAPAASSSVSAVNPDSSADHSELPATSPAQADASSPTVAHSDTLPLLQRPDIRALALQDDWQPLARQLRSMHTGQGLKHCPVCHQWFTRTQDIFRHLKRQHPLPVILESLRADWLTARTAAARSLCSWCRLTALGSGLSLQEAQRQEVQAELQLLQCWGEGALSMGMELDVANKRHEMKDAEDPAKERDSKWARPESKGGFGRGGRGKGNQQGQPKNPGPRRQPIRRSTEADTRAPEGMMWLLGKLLLRHEDQMGIDRTRNSFVMFFKKDSALSLVPLFVQKSQHWHALKEQKQEKMDEIAMPLRSFLLHTMLETLVKRIKDTVKNEEQLKTATTLQVFLPKEGDLELRIPFLSYNPETRALVPRQDQEPIYVSKMLEKLQLLQKQCLCPLAIMRFHSTQRLNGPLQGPTVPFLLQVGFRSPEAAELYLSLRSLANSAIWQLVGGSLRPEKMGRSALAAELARRLQGPCTQTVSMSRHLRFSASRTPPITAMLIRFSVAFSGPTNCYVIWSEAMHSVVRRMVTQAPAPDLWSSLQWALLHASWTRPHSQHDVAEYLVFCRRFVIPDLLMGRWQNRLIIADDNHPRCQVRDCGDAWPMLLAMPPSQCRRSPDSRLTIQRLIHAWKDQAAAGLTALDSEPSLLVLQINRFSTTANGAKDDTHVLPDPRILLPCFQHRPLPHDSALTVRYCEYQLIAVISHEGPNAASGHYRALLCTYPPDAEPTFWQCDDSKAPIIQSVMSSHTLATGYLYFYCRTMQSTAASDL
ncbi:unnamed protein product [Symbiodinium sp. CCMP2592]|nr:unnamed protein product [Symbiodinium sp. CCMP2592]